MADPAPQQPANLVDHLADVLMLPGGQPFPVKGQAQIEAHLGQVAVGLTQISQPQLGGKRVGFDDRFLKIKRGIFEPLGDRRAVLLWEMDGPGQNPFQNVIGAGENDHVGRHFF